MTIAETAILLWRRPSQRKRNSKDTRGQAPHLELRNALGRDKEERAQRRVLHVWWLALGHFHDHDAQRLRERERMSAGQHRSTREKCVCCKESTGQTHTAAYPDVHFDAVVVPADQLGCPADS